MARKLELRLGVWLVLAFLIVCGATAVYILEWGQLGPMTQLGLGVGLGVMALLIYLFSARKWLLVYLYRYGVFRPAERAQDAVELARADLGDLQQNEIDPGRLKAKGDMRRKAEDILERYNLSRALRPVLIERDGAPPKVDFERKQPFGKLEHYLYMHGALGLAAIAVTLYHADFSLGGPVSAALMITWLGACLTGIYGGWLYWVMPSQLAEAEFRLGFDETRRQMERIDHEIAEVGDKKPALKKVLEAQKLKLEAYYRPQVKRKLKLEAWLWIHVPLATAALVLLAFHIFSVWYY